MRREADSSQGQRPYPPTRASCCPGTRPTRSFGFPILGLTDAYYVRVFGEYSWVDGTLHFGFVYLSEPRP